MSARDELFEVISGCLIKDDAVANRHIDAFKADVLRAAAARIRDIQAASCFTQPGGCTGYLDAANLIDPDYEVRTVTVDRARQEEIQRALGDV